MKTYYRVCSALFIILIFVSSCIVVYAEGMILHDVPMTNAEIIEFMDGREFDVVTAPATNYSINCFDISDGGLIALCFNASPYARINIYNENGQFLYGYKLLNRKTSMTVFFEGENLSINFDRDDVIGTFNEKGDCIKMRRYLSTKENSDLLHSITFQPTEGTIGNKTYRLERDIAYMQLSWSRFVLEDSTGSRQMVYDATLEHNIQAILVYSFWAFLCIGVIRKIFKRIRNELEQGYEE